ncbi:MAG: dockerin type I repeat-containing protein, partial [Ruminococcus sp.]|nr:dockerin type I repeat-containing protein [Candidatus Copronaster equi]
LIASPVYAVDENLVTMTFKVKSTASNGTTGEIIIPIETMRTKNNPYGFLFCGIYTGSSFSSQVLQYSDDQSFDCTKAVLKFKVGSSDLGDVNGDKKINSSDALMVLESSVGKRTLTSAQKKKADVDSNGSINSSDALLILRYAVGEIKSF